ncbi:MAG: F0F1 ATP synthase subunit gamma [Microthrixaceae bacterium]|nr:F0F1 ATP synthase subunit gamma [Microthrixaceae bacterium]
MLESAASEHASRQRAMKAATDNAEELITKLTRKINQVRQDAITTEIMEIIGGAEALAEDRGDPEDLILDHMFSDPFPKHFGGARPPRDWSRFVLTRHPCRLQPVTRRNCDDGHRHRAKRN